MSVFVCLGESAFIPHKKAIVSLRALGVFGIEARGRPCYNTTKFPPRGGHLEGAMSRFQHNRIKPAQVVILGFLIQILVGACLLTLPVST